MGEYNIAPNTQIGKIVIDEKVYENENYYHIDAEKYSRGGEFIENMVTDNTIEYCCRWFHLANIEEFLEDMDEFYENKVGIGKYSNLVAAGFATYNEDKPFTYSPILPTSGAVQKAVTFNEPAVCSPITFYEKRNVDMTYEKLYARKLEKEGV